LDPLPLDELLCKLAVYPRPSNMVELALWISMNSPALRRRSRAGGGATSQDGERKSHAAPKDVRLHSSSDADHEAEVARLTRELMEALQQ
jgi:hypothetical protein